MFGLIYSSCETNTKDVALLHAQSDCVRYQGLISPDISLLIPTGTYHLIVYNNLLFQFTKPFLSTLLYWFFYLVKDLNLLLMLVDFREKAD